MTAQTIMQDRIDAQQALDAIEYGLRSIKACGSPATCTGPHAGQLAEARRIAESYGLTISGQNDPWSGATAASLRTAKAELKALLADITAELKALGGIRQLRMTFAAEAAHDFELTA